MQAVCGQLQTNVTALYSEKRTLLENRDKMQSVATEALRLLKTHQQQAADTIQSLKLKHAQELAVRYSLDAAYCFLTKWSALLCIH